MENNNISKDELKRKAVESFLALSSADEKIAEKYGEYINEYYKLPEINKLNVCKNVFSNFIKNGSIAIDSTCAFIVYEVEKIEDDLDPAIQAIRENNKQYNKRPNIDFSGMKYDI